MQKCTTFTYTQQVAPSDYALPYVAAAAPAPAGALLLCALLPCDACSGVSVPLRHWAQRLPLSRQVSLLPLLSFCTLHSISADSPSALFVHLVM
jgi:hypothetical protein